MLSTSTNWSRAVDPYYSVRIPWVPSRYATKWHPTTPSGPFASIVRGAFKSQEDAIAWAQANLNGTPYSLEVCP